MKYYFWLNKHRERIIGYVNGIYIESYIMGENITPLCVRRDILQNNLEEIDALTFTQFLLDHFAEIHKKLLVQS